MPGISQFSPKLRIVAIVAIFLLFVLIFFMYSNSGKKQIAVQNPSQTQQKSLSPSEVLPNSFQQTYKNESFTQNYPSDWTAKEKINTSMYGNLKSVALYPPNALNSGFPNIEMQTVNASYDVFLQHFNNVLDYFKKRNQRSCVVQFQPCTGYFISYSQGQDTVEEVLNAVGYKEKTYVFVYDYTSGSVEEGERMLAKFTEHFTFAN